MLYAYKRQKLQKRISLERFIIICYTHKYGEGMRGDVKNLKMKMPL